MLTGLPPIRLIDVLDVVVVAFIVYWILLFIRGTRAVQILLGLLVLLAMFVLARRIGMVTFQWLVGNFLGSLIVIQVVVFQSEIRRGLAKMGQARIFGRAPGAPAPDFLDDLAEATFRLAESRTGAILLIERDMGLSEYIEHGKALDAHFSYELLAAILSTASPIHDGAVVIRGERVAAAGVILPIPVESHVTKTMGTRRSSIGTEYPNCTLLSPATNHQSAMEIARARPFRARFRAKAPRMNSIPADRCALTTHPGSRRRRPGTGAAPRRP